MCAVVCESCALYQLSVCVYCSSPVQPSVVFVTLVCYIHFTCVHTSVYTFVLFCECMRWLVQRFSFTFPSVPPDSCCEFLSCLSAVCVRVHTLRGNFHFSVLFRYVRLVCSQVTCYRYTERSVLGVSVSL